MNEDIRRYCYKYPRPMVTADIALFTFIEDKLFILLIKRKGSVFNGYWALPGGFVEIDERIKHAAIRELREETGMEFENLVFLFYADTPARDPRGRTISIVYSGFYEGNCKPYGSSDAQEADWFSVNAIPQNLAFDHLDVITAVIKKWVYSFNNPYLEPDIKKHRAKFISGTKEFVNKPCSIEIGI